MFRIFAKYGTDEKALVWCPNPKDGPPIQLALEDQYGGSWLYVDQLKPGQVLRFKDGLEYRGFNGKAEGYCAGIESLKIVRNCHT